MKTIQEKIKKKNMTIQYLDELIQEYLDKFINAKEEKKNESRRGHIITLLSAAILVASSTLIALTVNTPLCIPALIALLPFLSASTLGLPISIITNISTKREMNKKINENEKKLNTALLRKEYENNMLQKLEEELEQNKDSHLEDGNNLVHVDENPYIEEEIEAFAFNTHKIIKARKSGKLKEFLYQRYNVGDKESLEMYEGMVDLYLNDKKEDSTSLVPKSKELVRK